MSSCNRRLFLALLAAPLAACGFTPAYGPQGGATKLTHRIEVAAPTDRDSYLVTRALEERLGRASAPDLRLDYTLDMDEERVAVTSNNITRRFNLVGRADYRLTTLDGAEVARGSAESFTGYSATGSTVATRAARREAEERLATILAEDIVTRLIAAAPGIPG